MSTLQNGWKLWYTEFSDTNYVYKTVKDLKKSKLSCFNVTVPCCFEDVLQKNGLLNDLYYSDNVFKAQDYEYYHQYYSITFDCDLQKPQLVFKGIDTVAEIYFNGELIGNTENAFIDHSFILKNAKKTGNELIVHIIPVMVVAEKYRTEVGEFAHNTNATHLNIRKSAYQYGWDIFPRLLGGGIWKDVILEEYKENALEDCYLYATSYKSETYQELGIYYSFRCDGKARDYEIEVKGNCRDSSFYFKCKAWGTTGNRFFDVSNPLRWWPKNEGEQNLYKVTINLLKDGQVVSTKTMRFGIRTVALVRTSCSNVPDGKFEFLVNGRKIFIMGTNWVPLDTVNANGYLRLQKSLELLNDLNCNMVRCWGGGHYESDEFYDYCDEHGILVWQDFMMACAVYPQTEEFAKKIANEIEFVVKRLRNHCSIALWAGDNENDCAFAFWGHIRRNPNQNIITRQVIPAVLSRLDTARQFLPSSPYFDDEGYKTGDSSEWHEWAQTTFFKDFDIKRVRFISEIGYYSLPSAKSLRQFLKDPDYILNNREKPSAEYLAHVTSASPDGTEEYTSRYSYPFIHAEQLFGCIPDNLEDFSKMTQISQAEALKFFIEQRRIARNELGGIIIWNLIDGYTQLSDSLVDYYYRKKLSYHFVRCSQQPLICAFEEQENGVLPLYCINERPYNVKVKYTVTDVHTNKIVQQGTADMPAKQSVRIAEIDFDKTFYHIQWEQDDGIKGTNHYCSALKDITYEQYLADLEKVGYLQFE